MVAPSSMMRRNSDTPPATWPTECEGNSPPFGIRCTGRKPSVSRPDRISYRYVHFPVGPRSYDAHGNQTRNLAIYGTLEGTADEPGQGDNNAHGSRWFYMATPSTSEPLVKIHAFRAQYAILPATRQGFPPSPSAIFARDDFPIAHTVRFVSSPLRLWHHLLN